MLHICIFSALYKPSVGGVEAYTENLSKELASMGHRVTIVTSNLDGSPSIESNEFDVEIIRLPCRLLLGGRFPFPRRNKEYTSLIDRLNRTSFDGMLVNTRFYPHSLEGLNVADAIGIKPILLDHGSAYLTLGNPVVDAALRAYEHLITNRVKKHEVNFYGVSQASLEWLSTFDIHGVGTLNNAIDAESYEKCASNRSFRDEFAISEDALMVAFVGRLVSEKGIPQLIQAFKQIDEKNADIHLVIAGDGPLFGEVVDASPNVHALGKTPRADVAALLIQSDVFCMPTRSEGFATSLLEAAACECAPVITKVGGVAEMIPDPSYGIVLNDANPEAICEAISTLYKDRAKCSRVAARAKERSKMFTWERTAESVVKGVARAQKHRRSALR